VLRSGSIAVLEGFFLAIKTELLRSILVPLRLETMCAEVARWIRWYNDERPHRALGGATPTEIFDGRVPAHRKPRIEPRARYPGRSPCAGPPAKVRGRRGSQLRLVVRGLDGGRPDVVPVVELIDAA
jgi:hypothetical protein